MKKLLLMLLLIPAFCFGDIVLTKEQITQMPVETLEELLCSQPGIVSLDGEIHMNGSISDDLIFLLNDSQITTSTALSIDLSVINRLEIITSKPVHETTEISSLVIRIYTLPHSNEFQLKINMLGDQLSSENSWNKNKLNLHTNIPILKNLSWSTFINLDRNDTRFNDEYENDPVEDLMYLTSSNFAKNEPYKDRNFFDKMNYNNANIYYEFSYDINPKSRLTLSHLYNNRYETPFDHNWKYALEHYKEIEQNENVLALEYQQVVNEKINFTFCFDYQNYNYNEKPKGISLDDYYTFNANNFDPFSSNELYQCTGIDYLTSSWGLIGNETDLPWSIMSDGMEKDVLGFVRPGSIYDKYIENSKNNFNINSHVSYVFDEQNEFVLGFNMDMLSIKNKKISCPWNIDQYLYDYYLDNYECPQLWMYDFTTLNATELADTVAFYNLSIRPGSESIYFTDHFFNGLDDYFIYNTYSNEALFSATKIASNWQEGYKTESIIYSSFIEHKRNIEGLSTVIGLKYLYLDNGEKFKVYENGRITQSYKLPGKIRYTSEFVPYISINYRDNYDNEFRMSYKQNVRNQLLRINGNSVDNYDFKVSDIYNLGLTKSLSDNFNLNLDFVQQSGSTDIYNEELFETEVEDYKITSYNICISDIITEKFSYSVNYNKAKLYFAEDIDDFDWFITDNLDFFVNYCPIYDINIGAMYSWRTGRLYTPENINGVALEANSKNMKEYQILNLKFSKLFKINKNNIQTYLLIKNVNDRKNEFYVHPYTGSPNYDGADISEPNSGSIAPEVQYVHDLYTKNPANVSERRTIVVGLEYRW
jgi:hypothetical protein